MVADLVVGVLQTIYADILEDDPVINLVSEIDELAFISDQSSFVYYVLLVTGVGTIVLGSFEALCVCNDSPKDKKDA